MLIQDQKLTKVLISLHTIFLKTYFKLITKKILNQN